MRLKQKIILNKKEYIIGELTVGLYYLFLVDFQQFLEEIFGDFEKELLVITEEQLKIFFNSYFEIKEEKKQNKEINNNELAEMLLINVGKYMKFFGNNYEDVMNIPFRVFIFMLDNVEVITGDKNFIFSEKKFDEEKKKLKSLFNN